MENRKRFPGTCGTFLLLAALAVAAPVAAQQGELWEVSSKMEMPGMPMAMPGQTRRVCVGKNHKDADFVPQQGDCRMVDGTRTGNKFTYKMDCTGKEPSSVDGAITFGSDAYDGRMRITMKQTGDAMDMTFAGKRVGECAATAN